MGLLELAVRADALAAVAGHYGYPGLPEPEPAAARPHDGYDAATAALNPADGAFLIEDGRVSRPLPRLAVLDFPPRVLATTEALTGRPRLAGPPGHYAAVCPALRARPRIGEAA